jgi:hypothetical protein
MWAAAMSLSGIDAGQRHRPRRKARHSVPHPTDERASPQTALRAIAVLSILTWLAVIAAVWGLCRLIGI